MTDTLTIATPKGASLEIDKHTGVKVNGQARSYSSNLEYSRELGVHYLALAGGAKAVVREEDVAAIRAFYAAIAARVAAEAVAWLETDAGRSATLTEKMYGRGARYSTH
jgi:hypothetical protein